MVYVMHIQKIYLGYTWHIQWIFSLKFFDIHSIYTVYVMHIWSINIIFAIKNVPCPCTCHVPFHLDSAVAEWFWQWYNLKGLEDCRGDQIVTGTHHPPAWTYWTWIFPALLVYRGYQNLLHHEHLACCPPSQDWAVPWTDKCHETLQWRGSCNIKWSYKDIICIYIVYTWYILMRDGAFVYEWYIHSIYMVYTWYIHGILHVYAVLIDMSCIYLVRTSWVCSIPFFAMIFL